MILLLNYLPWLICLLASYLAVKTWRKNKKLALWILVSGVAAWWLLLTLAATSYLPKGSVAPLQNPAFEETEQVMQDKLRKPQRNEEESRKHLEEISDWKKERNK